MKQMIIRFLSFIIALSVCTGLLMSCGDDTLGISTALGEKTTLSIGVLSDFDGITFDPEALGEAITLGDGFEYSVGDIKPVWRMLSAALGVEIVEVEAGRELRECDMVIGSISQLDMLAREGLLLDLSDYYSIIPSAKDALYENEAVFSYLGEARYGESGLYFIPTFKESAEPAVSAFIDENTVQTLLDGDLIGDDITVGDIFVEPYMPSEESVFVEVMSESGELTTVCKDYKDGGNILELLSELSWVGLSGKDALVLLKAYIDKTYGGFYGERRSDLFIGANAAYDADELCALLICIKANADALGLRAGTVPAAADTESAIKMMASLYGVRGLGGEGYTYINANGELCDSRTEAATYELLGRINDWISSGLLVLTDDGLPNDDADEKSSEGGGTPSFDADAEPSDGGGTPSFDADAEPFEGGKPEAVLRFCKYCSESGVCEMLAPIAKWYDGSNMDGKADLGAYFRFSESARTAEDIGIGISKKGTASSQKRREAALELIELAFTEKGRAILALDNIPTLEEEASESDYRRTEDYLLEFYGAGSCFFSPTYPRYIGTDECKIELSKAYLTGLVRTPLRERKEGMNWYTVVPILLPYTAEEYNAVLKMPEFSNYPSEITFGFGELSARIIKNGLIGSGFVNGDDALKFVFDAFGAKEYLALMSEAYHRLIIYYYEYQMGVEY